MPEVTSTGLTSLISAAQSGWQDLIEAPNGIGGVPFGHVLIPTNDFTGPGEVADEHLHPSGDAGLHQGRFDEQGLSVNFSAGVEVSRANQMAIGTWPFADQRSINDHTSLAADGHAVQAQSDALLQDGQGSLIVDAGIRHRGEAFVVENGTLEEQSAINGPNFQVGLDASVPGHNGASADFDVLQLEKLPLLRLESFSDILGQFTGGGLSNLIPHPTWLRATTVISNPRMSITTP